MLYLRGICVILVLTTINFTATNTAVYIGGGAKMSVDYCNVVGYGAPLTEESVSSLCMQLGVSDWEELVSDWEELRDSSSLWSTEFPDVHIVGVANSWEPIVYAMVKPSYSTAGGSFEVHKISDENMFQDRFRQQLRDFLSSYKVKVDGEIEPMIISYLW